MEGRSCMELHAPQRCAMRERNCHLRHLLDNQPRNHSHFLVTLFDGWFVTTFTATHLSAGPRWHLHVRWILAPRRSSSFLHAHSWMHPSVCRAGHLVYPAFHFRKACRLLQVGDLLLINVDYDRGWWQRVEGHRYHDLTLNFWIE